jgi:hypothetical protein
VLPSDFEGYLRRIRVQYARFVATRELARQAAERDGTGSGGGGDRGDGKMPKNRGDNRNGDGDDEGYWRGGGHANGHGHGGSGDLAGGEGALEHAAVVASRLEKEAVQDG